MVDDQISQTSVDTPRFKPFTVGEKHCLNLVRFLIGKSILETIRDWSCIGFTGCVQVRLV